MRVRIHVEVIADWRESTTVKACEFARPVKEFSAETVGLSLEDGKKLLQKVQQHVMGGETWEMAECCGICPTCYAPQRLKDYRVRRLDTVFGTVRFRSPRLISCNCGYHTFWTWTSARSCCEYPNGRRRNSSACRPCLSVSCGTAGERLQAAGHCPAGEPEPGSPAVKPHTEVTLTVDGGFVRSQAARSRNFEIVTGRIACPDDKPYVFAWVRSEVDSMQEQLMNVLHVKTAAPIPRVAVITDGGNGVQHLNRLLFGKVRSILDWFHISMRIRYLEQIIAGLRNHSETEYYTKRLLAELVAKLRRHFWHANAGKAQEKLRHIVTLCRIVLPETPGFQERLEHLDYRVREFFDYLGNNKGTLIDYRKRHRAGKPVSTAMAESAVNQVINLLMCKRQQMRWSPRGAHFLAQVRCAVINGDLAKRARRWPLPRETPIYKTLGKAALA